MVGVVKINVFYSVWFGVCLVKFVGCVINVEVIWLGKVIFLNKNLLICIIYIGYFYFSWGLLVILEYFFI